uniref:Serine/threonine kinase 38 like n=2 Tax=Equus TaxID=9789 RepID=A0A9L0SDB6_HORSE
MAMTAGTTTTFPMSNHTRERVTVAKLTLENFYSNLILQHEERETRQKKLEVAMEEEGLADEEKLSTLQMESLRNTRLKGNGERNKTMYF